jgi:hypothetical protein
MIRIPRALFPGLAAALVAALPAAAPLAAQTPQDSAQAVTDSLRERLEAAERAIERLRRQTGELDQAKVGSRSRNRVELSGTLLMNGFWSDARVNNSDIPTFVVEPQDTTGLPNGYGAASVRQTMLGVSVSGMQALGANLSGDLQLDFYGGQQPSSGGRTFPLPRIRTMVARLDWAHIGLLIGQESQIISPWNPSSFAAVGIPGFTNAGNLWFWVPQLRVTVETGARPRLGFQAAALTPMLGSPQGSFATQPDSAEKSQRPFVQGRVYTGWGDGDTETQIGIGIHRGWIATTGDSLLTSEAFTADARIAFGGKVVLSGEGFIGSALAGLGGGGVGQEFGPTGTPVDSRGGWVQLVVRPSPTWELGGGWGMDDPDDADLPATGRLRNMTIEGHLTLRPGGGFFVGGEVRRITTTYQAGDLEAWHINVYSGVAF